MNSFISFSRWRFIRRTRSVTDKINDIFSAGGGQETSVYTNRTNGTKYSIICFITLTRKVTLLQ